MNIRKVIQYLKLRSQLSEDELSIAGVMAGLTESERELLVESLQPQKAAMKRGRKAGTKTAAKSARGTSLQQQLQSRTKAKVDGNDKCTALLPGLGVPCGEPEDYAIHDEKAGYAAYHPFSSSSPARSAASRSSSRKSDEIRSDQSESDDTENALSASGD